CFALEILTQPVEPPPSPLRVGDLNQQDWAACCSAAAQPERTTEPSSAEDQWWNRPSSATRAAVVCVRKAGWLVIRCKTSVSGAIQEALKKGEEQFQSCLLPTAFQMYVKTERDEGQSARRTELGQNRGLNKFARLLSRSFLREQVVSSFENFDFLIQMSFQ
uniref:Ras-associating domain-containing protein n=1 Tax=Macrostomum lignano TaxID=282301 RepID=A0A1I8F9I7_9PLAT